jgi:hypothetical protein
MGKEKSFCRNVSIIEKGRTESDEMQQKPSHPMDKKNKEAILFVGCSFQKAKLIYSLTIYFNCKSPLEKFIKYQRFAWWMD